MIIKKITKMTTYYKVEFTDYETLKFHEKTLIKYHLLKRGLEISNQDFEEIMFDNEVNFAVSSGLTYLSGIHSKKEVRDKLEKKYSKESVKVALKELEKMNAINDYEYAKYFLDYCKRSSYGPTYFSYKLASQMVSAQTISELLEEYSKDDEIEAITRILEKYIKGLKNCSINSGKSKTKKYLLSRGFSDSVVDLMIDKNEALFGKTINESESLEKDYRKALKTYEKKYSGQDLKEHILANLLRKGYKYNEIKEKI